MNDWTCPYCRAYNKTGRCVKCGAFFEDKFDDIVVEEPLVESKPFEVVYEQAVTQQLEVVKTLHGDAHKKKSETIVGSPIKSFMRSFPAKPFILGIMLILLVFPFTQSYMFEGEPYDGGDNPTEPLFQLDILVLWEDNSKYNGLVEIWNNGDLIEVFYASNGQYDSEVLYDTEADLTFKILNTDMGFPLPVYTLSFVDMQDWTPGIYFDYPVVIRLEDGWQ